ncbi:MAG: hypothetical protein QXN57_03245 [Desulfurococcaceae archaeon]
MKARCVLCGEIVNVGEDEYRCLDEREDTAVVCPACFIHDLPEEKIVRWIIVGRKEGGEGDGGRRGVL